MPRSVKASPPTFTVRVLPDGEILRTRLPLDQANLVAVLFNRLAVDKNRRAELLREEDAVRWHDDTPIPLRPRAVRQSAFRFPASLTL